MLNSSAQFQMGMNPGMANPQQMAAWPVQQGQYGGLQDQGGASVDEYLNFAVGKKEKKSGTRPNSSGFAKKWIERLTRAKETIRPWKDEAKLNYGLYYNDKAAWRKAVTTSGYKKQITIFTNPIARNVDSARDMMLPKNPSFKVWPKVKYTYFPNPNGGPPLKRDNVAAARKYQEVANLLALELDLRRTIKRAVTDSLVTNIGVVKIAWDEVGQISHGSAHVEGDGVDGKVLGGGQIISSPNSELARPNYPWCVQVPWDRLIIDPTAGSWDQVNWIAEEIIVPTAGLDETGIDPDKQEDTISTLANVSKGDEAEEDGYGVRDEGNQQVDIKTTKYWEVHYREVERDGDEAEGEDSGFCYYTFDLYAQDGGKCRNHRKYDRDIGGFCYEFIQFKEIVGNLLGYSQVRLYKGPAANANLAKQLIMEYGVRAIPFLLADGGTDKKTMDAITDGTIAKCIKGSGPTKDKFVWIAPPPIGQDMFRIDQMAGGASDQMSGQSLNDRLTGGMDSATEAKIVAQNSGELTQANIDILRVFVARVIKKCVRIFGELLPDSQELQIPNGKGGFLLVEKQNLSCDVAIELDWQSTIRKDEAVERKLNMDLLSILVNAKASGMVPDIDLMPVLKKIVVSSGFEDANEIFIPNEEQAMDPAEQRMLLLSGEEVQLPPENKLVEFFKNHTEWFAMLSKDQQLKKLWDSQPGAVQRLLDYMDQMSKELDATGQAVDAGSLPKGTMGGGSGSQHNRPSEGVPSGENMQAEVSRMHNVGNMSGRKMGGM